MDAKNHQKMKPQKKRLGTPKKPPRGPKNDLNEISWVGFPSAPVPRNRRGEGRVGCTKPTYPQETDPLQQNYLSDRNLLRKSVKCDK